MENHFRFSDEEFQHQFKTYTLNPEYFSHEAHIRLACIYISKHEISKALKTIEKQLMDYVAHLGEHDKFNKTLTLAATKAVYHFMLKSKSDNFKDFIAEFPQLKNSFRTLIDCHYGFDIFTSQKAKTKFLEPDLLPFD